MIFASKINEILYELDYVDKNNPDSFDMGGS